MVHLLKLTTGEDIVSEASNEGNVWTLKNPARILLTQQGVGMIPFAPFAKGEKIVIREEHVVFHTEVEQEVANAYNAQYGNGIVIAGGGDIAKNLKVSFD